MCWPGAAAGTGAGCSGETEKAVSEKRISDRWPSMRTVARRFFGSSLGASSTKRSFDGFSESSSFSSIRRFWVFLSKTKTTGRSLMVATPVRENRSGAAVVSSAVGREKGERERSAWKFSIDLGFNQGVTSKSPVSDAKETPEARRRSRMARMVVIMGLWRVRRRTVHGSIGGRPSPL